MRESPGGCGRKCAYPRGIFCRCMGREAWIYTHIQCMNNQREAAVLLFPRENCRTRQREKWKGKWEDIQESCIKYQTKDAHYADRKSVLERWKRNYGFAWYGRSGNYWIKWKSCRQDCQISKKHLCITVKCGILYTEILPFVRFDGAGENIQKFKTERSDIVRLLQKLRELFLPKRKSAAAFVDYEYWFYSMRNLFHIDPDPKKWIEEVRAQYSVEDIYIYADFGSNGMAESKK